MAPVLKKLFGEREARCDECWDEELHRGEVPTAKCVREMWFEKASSRG